MSLKASHCEVSRTKETHVAMREKYAVHSTIDCRVTHKRTMTATTLVFVQVLDWGGH